MRRREFITLLAGATASTLFPFAASGQQGERTRRAGILIPAGDTPGFGEFSQALAELDYIEGRNIHYHVRFARCEKERLPQLARERSWPNLDVIVSATVPAARALSEVTRDIPIVLALIGNPLRTGGEQNDDLLRRQSQSS